MSLSDLSDLSELSSDEEDVPLMKSTQKATRNKKSKEYQITNTLRPPRTTQYTAKSLYDQIIENTIDLDPEYQRDVVWTEQKQSGIIDSILRNYYIPPVIFAVSSSDDGSELRTCIDGKQRLTSIQRFMDGLIPHKDSFTNQKMWFKQVGKTKRNLLSPGYITAFSNKQIVCVEYESLTDDQEREIFQRVQLGVALTPAERMQAITGPWPSLIRELQDETDSGFEGYLDWANGRGRNFQCLASVAFLIDKAPRKTIPTAAQLEKWLQEAEPISSQIRNGIFDSFRVFVDLVRAFGDIFHKPAKLAPIEFVMVGLLVHTFKMKLSPTQLSSAIKKMRADVRLKHEDIRQNGKVHRSLFEFISKKVKPSDLKSDMKGDRPASSKARIAQGSKAMKRKRKSDTDEESGDESVKPPPSKPAASRAVVGSSRVSAAGSSISKIPAKPKAPVKRASTSQASQPAIKPTMSSTSTAAGFKTSPTTKPSLPRILKVSNEASDTASSQPTISTPAQRKHSIPPVRGLLTASQQPSIKLEPSAPSLDRLGAIRAAKAASGTPIQSPTTPGGFQNGIHINGVSQPVQDPRRPQIQTNFDNASQQPQRSPWSATQSPIVTTPSFPTGMPLDQNQLQVLLARAGITQPQNQSPLQGPYLHQSSTPTSSIGQQPPNAPFPGRFSTNTPPMPPHTPAFTQNSNNPLHSHAASGNLNDQSSTQAPNGPNSSTGLPLQAGQLARNHIVNVTNGAGSSTPASSHTPLIPPPTSSSSSTSALPYPPTSASSTGSTWQDQVSSGEVHRGFDLSARRDRDYYSRRRNRSRDARDYDLGRSSDRDRRYSSTSYRERGRSRSRERDSGWPRNRGRGGSPTNNRYDPR